MGCDINLYVERYQWGEPGSSPCWVKLGPTPLPAPDPVPEPLWDPNLTAEEFEALDEAYQNQPCDFDYFPDDDGSHHLLGDRSYGWFGFLANVRNYSESPYISEPRGLPDDLSEGMKQILRHWERFYPDEAHSHSYLLVEELLEYDYSQRFDNRRCGYEQRDVVLSDFLGTRFFYHLDRLRSLGPPCNLRLVFFFDS